MPDIESVFIKNYKLLFRIIYGYTKDIENTKDILQDTFLKAYKSSRDEILPEKLLPWMIVIAKNTAKTFLKKQVYMNQIDEQINQISYDSDLLNFTIFNALEDLINTIPDDLREAIKIHLLEDIPLRRISRERQIQFTRIRYWHDKLIKDMQSIIGEDQ
jgi:RNA polymerase sigma factor (sigma-70 family)